MKKALFLCTGDPCGIDGGGFATRAYLKTICDIFEGKVDIFGEEEEKLRKKFSLDRIIVVKGRTKWQKIVQYFHRQIERYSHKAIEYIKQHHDEYSCSIINGSILAGAVVEEFRKYGIPVIAIYHNFEPDYYRDNCHGIKRLLWLPPVKSLERTAYLNCDVNLFLSKQDMGQFERVYGKNGKVNTVIGVYEFDNREAPKEGEHKLDRPLKFVITGSMDFYQGIDGVSFFFESLYKFLPSNSHIIIAGRNPSDSIIKLCENHKNVTLIPNPPIMDTVISEGDVYLCPTRLGGGVKLRVMDGLRLGLPVITHACSARGYDLFWDSSAFEIYNTPEEFEKALNRILDCFKNGMLDKTIVYNSFMSVFSYEAGCNRMKRVLKEMGILP